MTSDIPDVIQYMSIVQYNNYFCLDVTDYSNLYSTVCICNVSYALRGEG